MTNLTADDILLKLDERPASPGARAEIAYRILLETHQRDELINEIIAEYRLGFKDPARLRQLDNRLNNERSNRDRSQEKSAYHLAFGLLPTDDTRLDGHLAEYYFDWAENLGIPESNVCSIILELQFRP